MKGNNGKDAYWFSHDSNAKDDPKCMLLIDQLGLEGYGIYWVLVEILREQPDFSYPMALIPAIAKRYGTSVPKVEAVITGFGLFEIRDEKFFYSPSLITRVLSYKEKQDAKSAAAIKANMIRWQREKNKKLLTDTQTDNQNGIRLDSERNPDLSQLKEIKGNKNIIESKDSCSQENLFGKEEMESKPKNITPEEMVEIWNQNCGMLSKTQLPLIDERKKKAKLRIKEFGKTRDEQKAVLIEVVRKLANSKFANGDNDRGWRATFGFILEKGKWVNVLDGMYDSKPLAGVKDIRDIKNLDEVLWDRPRK